MAAVRGSGWVALERRLEVASQVTGEREDIAAEQEDQREINWRAAVAHGTRVPSKARSTRLQVHQGPAEFGRTCSKRWNGWRMLNATSASGACRDATQQVQLRRHGCVQPEK
eukprot:515992-Rhodomonas_salina.1